MKRINIRTGVSYQVDYLDLKNLNIPGDKIREDLQNIQSLTNIENSLHLSLVVTSNNFQNWKKTFLSLLGVPIEFFLKYEKIDPYVNTFLLSEELKTLKFFKKNENEETKLIKENIIGVMFIHTLLYENEISAFLNYFQTFRNIISEDKQLYYLKNTNNTATCSFDTTDSFCSPKTLLFREKIKFLDEKFELKVFTLMVPIYIQNNFVQSFTEIHNKESLSKKNSYLNWVKAGYTEENTCKVNNFGGFGAINDLLINFTYFPPKVNKTYYNKYVETMVESQITNFIKIPALTYYLSFIENEKVDKTWKELNSVFGFSYGNNIINTIPLNELLNNEDIFTIEKIKIMFLNLFLGETDLQKHLISMFNVKNESLEITFKTILFLLEKEIKKVNVICIVNKINPLFSKSVEKTLIQYLFYFFLFSIMDHNLTYVTTTNYRISYKNNEKVFNELIITNYLRKYMFSTQQLLAQVLNIYNTKEAITICLKAKELYFTYLKDSFLLFITIEKDFDKLIKEHIHKNDFLDPLRTKWMDFIYVRLLRKEKSLKLTKTPLEYKLFYELLKHYRGVHIKDFYIKENTLGNHPSCNSIFDYLLTPEFKEITKSETSLDFYIKKFTIIFETIFNLPCLI